LEALENLHSQVAETLSDKLKSPDVTAADISAAIKFLKDNGIDAIPTKGSPLGNLADTVPFQPGDDNDEEQAAGE
jgi:hypothetical protein